jgi:hypothetical protein
VGQQKRAAGGLVGFDYIDIPALAGAKERRAPFSAEEDRWMKAMDNLRKPRCITNSKWRGINGYLSGIF